MSEKRTDIHRPSVIDPSEYVVVAFLPMVDVGNFMWINVERERLREHMVKTGGKWSTHRHGGTCHVCGVWAMSMVVWYHEPTNTYIKTGETCAEKMDYSDSGEFSLFKTHLKHALDLKAGKRKAEAVLAEAGLEAAWPIITAEYSKEFKYEELTIRDIGDKLIKYGSISEGQERFVGKLLKQIEARSTPRNEPPPVPVPVELLTGRHVFTGTLLGTKVEDTPFGRMTKMLFRDERGFKLWGTCPTGLGRDDRGAKISFHATLTLSNKDNAFAFFSRPTKAVVLAPREPTPEEVAKKAELKELEKKFEEMSLRIYDFEIDYDSRMAAATEYDDLAKRIRILKSGW